MWENLENREIAEIKRQTNGNVPKKPKKDYLNYGEEDQMEIQGFIDSHMKRNVVIFFYVLTIGILRLFFHWYPHLHLKATHTRCSLKKANKVLVIDNYRKYKSYFVKDIKTLDSCSVTNQEENILECNLADGRQKKLYQARIIKCKKLLYVWDDDTETFEKLMGFDKGVTRRQLHACKGQSREKQQVKRVIYGNNEISVPVQTILTLLVLEALTPFYMFQLFSLMVWLAENYYYYGVAVVIMSVVGIGTSIVQTRKNQKNLRGTVNFVDTDTAMVCRGGEVYETVPTVELVPGDLIVIPKEGCEMQCDAVLITGTCVVNESMLTGESVPIIKTPMPEDSLMINLKDNMSHTVFCGTKIIQAKNKIDDKVLAVVIRTGYLTTKGELIRSILYPPPADFKFETDSYKFIGILFIIAIIGVIYTVVSKTARKIQGLDILIKALDIFTIAVPPALPATMTIGKLYALNRLKNKKIFCINSRVINVSGSTDCICFDKTGTLTEDELDMWGIVPVDNKEVKSPLKQVTALPYTSEILRGMATCHSLSIIKGELGGDPLDIKMFESTGWKLHDTTEPSKPYQIAVKPAPSGAEKNDPEIGIIKQYQFSSNLQRMSVIVQSSDSQDFTAFCKGSPEMIMALSNPSCLPPDLMDKVYEYTVQGYRVIAIGKRCLPGVTLERASKMTREEVECDLDFCGLIVLENKLKPQTAGIINVLKKANFKVVMITGDNLQTGVHVARECGMINPAQNIIEVIADEPSQYQAPAISYKIIASAVVLVKYESILDVEKSPLRNFCFAVTGKSWGNIVKYFPELIPKIVVKGTVFARMSGMQKQQLVEELKNLEYYVAMCGDGANDCGALKAAHVGISLSEAESSVASPFTSKIQNISCVPKVVKEGRAALITSFGIFKLMLCYSLVELSSVIILYGIDANLTSIQYLFIDIFLILNFASFFGMTKAHNALDRTPPRSSLMGFVPIASMSSFLMLSVAFQLAGYYWIQTYSWFTPFVYSGIDDEFSSYENFSLFVVSTFQYIIMCVVFSKGKPYRKPLYTNIPFTITLLVTTLICVWLTTIPPKWLAEFMELKTTPMEAVYALLGMVFVNFLCCLFFEDVVVEYFLGRILVPRLSGVEKPPKYTQIANELSKQMEWPVVTEKQTILNTYKDLNGVYNEGFEEETNRVIITKC